MTIGKNRNTTQVNVTYWKNIAVPTWMEFMQFIIRNNQTMNVKVIFHIQIITDLDIQNVHDPLLSPQTALSSPCLINYHKVFHMDNQEHMEDVLDNLGSGSSIDHNFAIK